MNDSPPLTARVLVIDDDPVLRELLSALLSVEGHAVTTAENGEDALQLLQSGEAYDVVLTDVQLPGLTGPQLAGRLRAAAPGSILLGMSGSEPGVEAHETFDAFLLKPFTPEDFRSATSLAKHDGSSTPEILRSAPATAGITPLDETTYARLAASLQPPQLAQLYELTLSDADSRIRRLGEAHAAGDVSVWRSEAHALKGGCSMVGATELASLAARAETGSGGDTPHPGDFETAAERLRSNLTARFRGIT